jgi:hypothetical protein
MNPVFITQIGREIGRTVGDDGNVHPETPNSLLGNDVRV